MTLRRALGLLSVSFLSSAAWAGATFAIEGNYRFGANFFKNADVVPGANSSGSDTTAFLESRLLLRPNVVIDDRFVVKSEVNVLQTTQSASNSVPEAMGLVLGGAATPSLRRVWLEWASDFGVLRVGRMPKSWGLGILYSAGDDVYDDFGTTVDRIGFQALLGNVSMQLGYEKSQEGTVNFEGDDGETYELALGYGSPDMGLDVGLLYGRAVRAPGVGRNSSHDLSVFVRKTIAKFNLGGEFVLSSEDNRGSNFGALAQVDFRSGPLTVGGDFALAYSPQGGTVFSLHPNYRPLLILFQQSLGSVNVPGTVRGGSTGYATALGSSTAPSMGQSTFAGKVHGSWGFAEGRYVLGADIGAASTSATGGGFMGVEADVHLTQKWYDNFSSFYGVGVLFPGVAFGPSRAAVWGGQVKAALTF